jgi:hypothetical protein
MTELGDFIQVRVGYWCLWVGFRKRLMEYCIKKWLLRRAKSIFVGDGRTVRQLSWMWSWSPKLHGDKWLPPLLQTVFEMRRSWRFLYGWLSREVRWSLFSAVLSLHCLLLDNSKQIKPRLCRLQAACSSGEARQFWRWYHGAKQATQAKPAVRWA